MELMNQAEWQNLIDSGALSLRPLVHRCQCGQVISERRYYCYACITAEIAFQSTPHVQGEPRK